MNKSSPLHENRWCGNSQGLSAFGFSSNLFITNDASVGSDTYKRVCVCIYIHISTYKAPEYMQQSQLFNGCHCLSEPNTTSGRHCLKPLLHLPTPICPPAAHSTSPRLWQRAHPCRSPASYQNQEVHASCDEQLRDACNDWAFGILIFGSCKGSFRMVCLTSPISCSKESLLAQTNEASQ